MLLSCRHSTYGFVINPWSIHGFQCFHPMPFLQYLSCACQVHVWSFSLAFSLRSFTISIPVSKILICFCVWHEHSIKFHSFVCKYLIFPECSVTKQNKLILPCSIWWMNLEDIMVNEISQPQKDGYSKTPCIWSIRTAKSWNKKWKETAGLAVESKEFHGMQGSVGEVSNLCRPSGWLRYSFSTVNHEFKTLGVGFHCKWAHTKHVWGMK